MAETEHGRAEKATGAAEAAARPLSEAERRQIGVLKAVVIGLGVLIVAGLAVLLTAVVLRGGGGGGALPPEKAMRVPLPAGAEVEEMQLSGHVLALRLKMPGGRRQIVVIDARRGRVLRRIWVGP